LSARSGRAGTFSAVSDEQSTLAGLIGAGIDAALAAGREILEVYEGPIAVDHKDDRSPLTEADRRAHRAIMEVLKDTGLPVLSEEGRTIPAEERQAWDRYWLVDPLDGTKEFIKRNGEFTVNIALMQRDELPGGPLGTSSPIGGVLYVPVKDILYFAWSGGGAYRQEGATLTCGRAYERAAMATRLPITAQRTSYTIVASRSHQSPETEAFIRNAEQEHGAVQLTSMGSALKICLVAEGAADVYPRYAPTMEWDTAAGHAICMEANTQLVDVTTDAPMRYNKHELVNNWFIVQ
jgi:3'(2'), 5'-bisphosphate nucleotidase